MERQLTEEEQVARGDFQAVITERIIKPFLLDLESSNGTFVNGEKIEAARYYEIMDKDIIKLGHSTREYVLMSR